jgi:hypothetical protein
MSADKAKAGQLKRGKKLGAVMPLKKAAPAPKDYFTQTMTEVFVSKY